MNKMTLCVMLVKPAPYTIGYRNRSPVVVYNAESLRKNGGESQWLGTSAVLATFSLEDAFNQTNELRLL